MKKVDNITKEWDNFCKDKGLESIHHYHTSYTSISFIIGGTEVSNSINIWHDLDDNSSSEIQALELWSIEPKFNDIFVEFFNKLTGDKIDG